MLRTTNRHILDDQVIAVAGASKKDLMGKAIGIAAEKVMEERKAISVGDTAIHSHFRGNNDNGIEKTSRMRRVRRISFGITTLPRSSILRTIPVAFIHKKLPS